MDLFRIFDDWFCTIYPFTNDLIKIFLLIEVRCSLRWGVNPLCRRHIYHQEKHLTFLITIHVIDCNTVSSDNKINAERNISMLPYSHPIGLSEAFNLPSMRNPTTVQALYATSRDAWCRYAMIYSTPDLSLHIAPSPWNTLRAVNSTHLTVVYCPQHVNSSAAELLHAWAASFP